MKPLDEALKDLIDKADPANKPWGLGRAWSILSAIRGPDDLGGYDVDMLKYLTTSRVRAILLDISPRWNNFSIYGESDGLKHINFIGFCRSSPLSHEEIIQRNQLLSKASPHFRTHFINAMGALQELGYPVPSEEMNFEEVEE